MRKGRFLLLYATQKGQAASIAEHIKEEALLRSIFAEIYCVSEINKSYCLKKEHAIVLVSSTTDEGCVPDSAHGFMKFLKNQAEGYLSHVSYAILGLGDTNYTNFCNGCRLIEAQFKRLGAVQFYATGYADDGTDLESVVEPWIDNLWTPLLNLLNQTVSITNMSETDWHLPVVPQPCVQVVIDNVSCTGSTGNAPYHNAVPLPFQTGELLEMTVSSGRQLTTHQSVKLTYEIELCSETAIDFFPGDAIGVLCPNDPKEVERMASRLSLDLNSQCTIEFVGDTKKAERLYKFLPKVATVKELLTTSVELRGVLKKVFLKALGDACSDEKEKNNLYWLSSREGSEDYKRKILEDHWFLSDILLTYKTCQPNLALILTNLPRLQPRYYSISNYDVEKRRFRFIFRVTEFTNRGSLLDGLCTGWFKRLIECQAKSTLEDSFDRLALDQGKNNLTRVKCFRRSNNTFKLSQDPTVGCVLVGSGTGIAPFLSYLAWRSITVDKANNSNNTWMVFFGCRDAEHDYFCREELQRYATDGAIVNVAFSRSEPKKYVQDLMCEQNDEVFNVVANGGCVYVCGDAQKMENDVRSTLVSIIQKKMNLDAEQATKFVAELKAQQRYLCDVWL